VAVAKSDEGVAAVVQLADGQRTLEELAQGAGLELGTLQQTLRSLVELGAVRFSTGS
jgi:DNA-binding IclR family transcriptional regulator